MTDTPPPIPKSARRIRLAFLISLGLNLAVAGLVAGALIKGPPGPAGEIGLWRYGAALPGHYRRDLMHDLRAERATWEGPRRALRSQRAALARALTAKPYDPAAVARVLTVERDALTALADRGTALLLAQIARMSPDERRVYAQALQRRHPGPPGRRP